MKSYYFLAIVCVFFVTCNKPSSNITETFVIELMIICNGPDCDITETIILELPKNDASIDLTSEETVTFQWSEEDVPVNQSYSLWIDKNIDFSSPSAQRFDVDDKDFSFSAREFDILMKDFGFTEGKKGTVYWTVVHLDEMPENAAEIRKLNVQRILLAGYAPVTVYEYTGRTFYVDSEDGNDSNTGASETAAWKTLDKVNSYAFTAGDVIRFKCGGLWRGQLRPRSGTPSSRIVYTSYGFGRKPILQVSIAREDVADWKETSSGVWETDTGADLDIGNIIFNHGEACGVKKSSMQELAQEGDYYSNKANKKCYLKYGQNPATLYESIELAPKMHGINCTSVSNITIDGLTVRYSGAHGISSCCNSNITVRRCDIYWVGGCYHIDPPNPVRYGNAVEFWVSSSNMLVENNRIWEIYDAGVTNQGKGTGSVQTDIIYRNNLIWNCEMSFEYWNSASTQNILFENNTCIDAGSGWGHTQRPDRNGSHLNFYQNGAKTSNFTIRNNIFMNATNNCFRMDSDWLSALVCDHNLYYTTGSKLASLLFKPYLSFEDMRQATGLDANSIFMEPDFFSPQTRDYRLFPEVKMSNGIMPGILQWDTDWNQ